VVGLRSPQSIGNIVRREIGRGAPRELLGEDACALFVERSEALLRANWPAALAGDFKASMMCLRVLTCTYPPKFAVHPSSLLAFLPLELRAYERRHRGRVRSAKATKSHPIPTDQPICPSDVGLCAWRSARCCVAACWLSCLLWARAVCWWGLAVCWCGAGLWMPNGVRRVTTFRQRRPVPPSWLPRFRPGPAAAGG